MQSLSSKLALSLAALALAACSDPPSAVAEQRVEPAPVVVAAVPDAGSNVAVAPKPRSPPPTLLEQEALAHDDDGADFHALGEQLVKGGKPGEAVTAFRHALYGAPTAKAWHALGRSYLSAGQRERGIAALEEAIVVDNKHVGARESLARALLSSEPRIARTHAQLVVKARPDDAAAHALLGRAYMQLSMWNEAIASFERSLVIDPSSTFAHNNLGYSALQVGRTELAVQHLEAILDLAPQRPYMLNNLGLAYERAGRGPDALAAYSLAVEKKPGYVNALVNQQRVSAGLTDEQRALALEIKEELQAQPTATSTMAAASDDEAVIVLEE